MSVDRTSVTVVSAGHEPEEAAVSVPASLGAVGYAAFAFLQPIPLGELVPFQTVMSAFEAEAAGMVPAPAAQPPAVEPPPVEPLVAPPVATVVDVAPVEVAEPVVVFTEGGYRPEQYSRRWADDPNDPATPEPESSFGSVPDLEIPPEIDGPQIGETAALDELPWGAEPNTPAPVPAAEPFTEGGYATDYTSDDRRARQVLDELSFLFDGT